MKRPLSNFVRQHKQREGQLLWTLSLLAGNVSLDKDLKAFDANSTGLTQSACLTVNLSSYKLAAYL